MTDSGQADHFRLVFASARRAAILPPSEDQPPRVSHVGFGLVLGSDGKRYRTRSSEVRLSPRVPAAHAFRFARTRARFRSYAPQETPCTADCASACLGPALHHCA